MKKVLIVHNPSAGSENHNKRSLIKTVKKAGYQPDYVSTDDKGWADTDLSNTELLIVAGGDGTVRKVSSLLIKRSETEKNIPIALLPYGTANNISKTLHLQDDIERHIKNFEQGSVKNFDFGLISGLDEINFFIEGIGFGIFPELVAEMKKNKKDGESREDKLRRSAEVMLGLLDTIKAEKAKIVTDDFTIEESFILMELMNIKSIGPNLLFAPEADPGDGVFDLVMIPEGGRESLKKYLTQKLDGEGDSVALKDQLEIRQVKNLKIEFPKCLIHVDDELIKDHEEQVVEISLSEGRIVFVA